MDRAFDPDGSHTAGARAEKTRIVGFCEGVRDVPARASLRGNPGLCKAFLSSILLALSKRFKWPPIIRTRSGPPSCTTAAWCPFVAVSS
jgi:hypothetical protein